MDFTITIRLDKGLEKKLKAECRETGRRRSDVVRDALRQHLKVAKFDRLREKIIPYAEAQGIYTDEDVFRIVS